jgi:hypothetical protein
MPVQETVDLVITLVGVPLMTKISDPPAQTEIIGSAPITPIALATFIANGTPDSYAVKAGSALPAGIALSPAGVVSGALTAPGTFTFTISATKTVG